LISPLLSGKLANTNREILAMIKREIFRFALAVALACTMLVSTIMSTESVKSTDLHGWEKLNLNLTTIAGTSVYYEECLKPKLPVFEKHCRKFLAERKNLSDILAKKEQIINEVNCILGATESDIKIKEQTELLTKLFGIFSKVEPTFYLVTRDAIKNFLRAGGQLPNCTYDKATDTVLFKPEFKTSSDEGPPKDFDFILPVASDDEFEKDVSLLFQVYQQGLGSGTLDGAIHEVTELTLLRRVRPVDQYYRWFSDGCANTITIEILKKYLGIGFAKEAAKPYDVNEYKELESETNLYYWMRLNFCIETPLVYENKLKWARYAYATYEVQHLIEGHGISCIKKILDNVCQKEPRNSENLLLAIKEVTGEDIQSRLSRYQTFQTRQEGIAKYANLHSAALDKEDYEQIVINTIRLLELQDSPLSPTSLQMRQEAALWLFNLGYERAADEVMLSFMEELKRNAPQQLYDSFSAGFIVYALQCDKPQKARSAAEYLLKDHPDYPPALTVRMQLLADEGELEEAKKIAHRIYELADEGSFCYKAASEVLATKPKQQYNQTKP
jgi:hypothetical protein